MEALMSTFVLALLDIAMRITKWIVRRLAKWAVTRVVTWMRSKVRTFKDRWSRARIEGDAWRVRWNEGRIGRWTKAADWIEARALKALGEAARTVCKLPAFKKLPDYASCERAVAA
jgi:hypothetical protein